MSKQWSKVTSVTEEPVLLEVISEELSKRLQVEEDFVWVDMPETLQDVWTFNSASPESMPENLFLPNTMPRNISNVVQFEIDNDKTSLAGEFFDKSEYDKNKDCLASDEELYGTDYDNLCPKKQDKLFNPSKIKYSKPHWLKIRECSIYRGNEKSQISNKQSELDHKKNKCLIPAMKFDESTTEILKMLIKNRYLGMYSGLVGTGKNSLIYQARCSKKPCTTMPLYNAVKVYKTNKNEERNRIIYQQVQREFDNLNSLRRFRVLCDHSPRAIKAKDNVIVMQFVGFEENVAQSVADLPCEKDQAVYNAIIEFMDKCYNLGYLVHGSLSASKILYWLERPWFVGWSHSVKRGQPQALTKLMKDIHFVTEFYKKRSLNVKSALDIFKQITNKEKTNDKLLEIIQSKDLYDKYETNPNRRRRTSPVKPTNDRFKR